MSFNRITAIVATSGALTGILWANRETLTPYKAKASTVKFHIDEGLEKYEKGKYSWNENWDYRAPNRTKSKGNKGVEGDEEVPKPTASRHLILIRHGQYEHWHDDSDMKVLTELGRRQAVATGERLKQLGESYTIMYYSTLPRATETAQIIRYSVYTAANCTSSIFSLIISSPPFSPPPSDFHFL